VTDGRSRLTAGVTRANLAILALVAYVPVLLTKPGRMPTDTKLFLYLDPGRLIADAPFTWDTRQFGGWVPHQTIAYLWPQGPWYWVFEQLGVPDWVAHRLWIGTLLFLGAWGVLWASRLLGLTRGGALAASFVYMLSPYVLPYLSRTSAMLLPWAALGWIVGLTIRAATSGHRWRHPALLALVLLSCSAVNATAVMMIAPAPVLWLLHAVLQRTVSWQRAVATAARIGVLATSVSLWWIAMLRAQGTWGADVLSFSESLQATSLTSTSTETLRGAGYWLFYIRDAYAFTTTAAQPYMESGRVIVLSFAIVILCLLGLAVTRWSQRRYAALLVFVGIVLAVGVHPIDNASPLMSPLAENSRSALALAIRSSTRAIPMSNLGLALGVGALVTAIGATRWRLRVLAPALVMAIAVVNFPVLWNGGMVDPALERDQDPPAAWQAAADDLSAGSSEFRVLQLPGSEFGAFRWGYTVDPPLPGMTTKPLVTRDLLPLGSAGLMDLLYALDDRVQTGTLDAAALAPVARFLGVDTIWLANDLAFDRFRTPRPAAAADALLGADDIGAPTSYGDPVVNVPDIPMVDEHALVEARSGERPLPIVQLAPVADPVAIVRTSERVVVLVGSGDGILDAAAAGLLHGDEAVLYAADQPTDDAAMVILTDTNRDRAHHWRSSQDVTGFTESGGPGSDVLRFDEGDQRLPVFGPVDEAAQQTTAALDSGLVVRASGYGEPFAYRPEQRPAMAVDGDADTAWVVADRSDPVGHFIEISDTDGRLTLLQPADTDRRITSVRITDLSGAAAPVDVVLDDSSLTTPGQQVDVAPDAALRITITGVTPGRDAVGFAELGIGEHTEVVRLPSFDEPADTPFAVVLTRERVDPLNRWRSDPERSLERAFTTAADHTVQATLTLRMNARADEQVLNDWEGTIGPVANRRLTGDLGSRAVYAADGDPATAWTSPFDDAIGSSLRFDVGPLGVDTLTLQQPVDELHSTITGIAVANDTTTMDLTVPPPDADGISTVELATPLPTGPLQLSITAIEPRLTTDRRFAEPITLPVALREVTSPGLSRSVPAATTSQPTCHGVGELDGAPLGVELDGDLIARLMAGDAVDVPTCDGADIELAAGTHRLSTTPGIETGIDVDRVVLRTADAAPSDGSTPQVTVTRTRTSRTATVEACPDGCWLVMGEGFNVGWTARTDDADLGTPTQISGGMNGWWLPPSTTPTVVHIEWGAQTPVTVALLLSLLAVAGCTYLALRRRPARRAAIAFEPAPPRIDRHVLARTSWTDAGVAAIALVLLTALVAAPRTALLAVVPAVLVVVFRRPRIAALAGVGLMALLSARILQRVLQFRPPANAGWPGWFERMHRPGLLVVVLVLCAALSDRDGDATASPPTTN
jgi:arabinofuranan 3-O-arabinosyltransferase